MTELVKSIDMHEDNWGMGDHRGWPRKDREAYHAFLVMEHDGVPIEECDCNIQPRFQVQPFMGYSVARHEKQIKFEVLEDGQPVAWTADESKALDIAHAMNHVSDLVGQNA